MKKRLKKSLLVLILSLVALILGTTKSSAVLIGYGDLAGSYNLYCVQHGQYMNGPYDYQVANTVTITGRTATDSWGRKTTNSSNAILAYILGGGNYRTGYSYGGEAYTERQQAVWGYINTWIANSGTSFGLAGFQWWPNGTYDTGITTEARNYAKNVSKISPAAIKSTTPNPVITSNAYAGPFNVKYAGSISSTIVKDSDGNQITSGLAFYNKKGQKITSIKSGKDFYIKNNSGKQLKQLSIYVESKQTISATISFLTCNYEGAPQRLIYVEPSTTTSKAHVDINIKTYGDLVIKKVDSKTKNAINGTEFKIKTSKGWLQKTNSGYKYDQTFAKATPFTTANGKGITLKDLQLGTYHVYETKAAQGYDLAQQEGYNAKNKWVDFGTVKIDGSKQEVTKTYSNAKAISIKGYVWVDVPDTKNPNTDSRYDTTKANDKKVAGVIVNLKQKGLNKVIATTKTDANGNYVFDKKVTEATIKNYYVEFNYQGTAYKNYIPVAFNSAIANEIVENGSRAMVNSMPKKDVDFRGIATTYTGTAKEATYGLSGNLFNKLYVSNEESLNNINLGIKALKETDYRIEQNIAYVKIAMKGYTYTYNYGGTGNKNLTAAPTVNWKGRVAYSRDIYPSDVAYEEKNAKNDLKVYVVYRTDITNTTNYNIEELYKEQKLMVTKLTDKFDTERYALHDNNWKANGDTATITDAYLKQIYGNGITKNNTAISFIEFEVKRDAILQVLKNPEGISEKNPTVVTSTAHHIYTRKDYSWQNDITKYQEHQTADDIRSSHAPYLIFKLGEKRNLSGKVFEDKVITTDGQKLGDGKYDNENVVNDVKVELLDVDGTVSDLYDVENAKTISRKAEKTTSEKGDFTLTGVVPGDYFIRFTYGDGTQRIYDAAGKEVKLEKVLSKDYKSTIVTSEVVRDAIENGSKVEATKHEWYKKLDGSNYSVAVDNMDSRKSANEDSKKNVLAFTPRLSVTVENTAENTLQVKEGEATQVPEFKGFNFGIITEPEQKVEIEKVVTNMKLTNAQNNLVFEGNPATARMKGVSDLSGGNKEGSSFVRTEIEEQAIYGSTLELTYGIKVTNVSDVNYYGEKYYRFGDNTGAYEVTLKVDEVEDDLDGTLQLVGNTDGKKTFTVTGETVDLTEGERTKQLAKIIIKGWDTIYTTENKARPKDKIVKTSDTANLGATRVLSSEDEDMEIINKAQILKATNDSEPGDTNKEENVRTIPAIDVKPLESKAVVTITPPTGKDMQSTMLYVIAGAITLVVLATGVIIIKKKVL